jgi:hypothetical protein
MTREELNTVRGYVSNIQAIKEAHNTDKLPINYGTICTITANGWKLIEELKALEQESQTFEWCHDCKEYDHDKHCCPRFNNVIRKTVEEIKQPKTAHWIVEKGGSYLGMKNGYCSNCKNYYTNDWDEMKYCPNCGADMREVEE